MPKPPVSFVQAVQLLDDMLSVRWGEHQNCWLIERKAVVPQTEIGYLKRRMERMRRLAPENPQARDLWPQIAEELKSALDGKRIILATTVLGRQIYDALVASDIRRYGGYARFAAELEAGEIAEYERTERLMAARREDRSREVHEKLEFIWRKRENQLLAGDRSLDSLIYGKSAAKKKKDDTKRTEPRIVLADS